LRERDVEFDVVEYLKSPFERETLESILSRLPGPPTELIRQDKNFQELALDVENYETADAVIDLLLEYPILMQRPIFVVGNHAVICRPSERALELL
jgi:arsenate reductase